MVSDNVIYFPLGSAVNMESLFNKYVGRLEVVVQVHESNRSPHSFKQNIFLQDTL